MGDGTVDMIGELQSPFIPSLLFLVVHRLLLNDTVYDEGCGIILLVDSVLAVRCVVG